MVVLGETGFQGRLQSHKASRQLPNASHPGQGPQRNGERQAQLRRGQSLQTTRERPRSEAVGQRRACASLGEKSSVRAPAQCRAWLPQARGGPSTAPAPPWVLQGLGGLCPSGSERSTQSRRRVIPRCPFLLPQAPQAVPQEEGVPEYPTPETTALHVLSAPTALTPQVAVTWGTWERPRDPEAGQLGAVPEGLWLVPPLPTGRRTVQQAWGSL